MHIFHYYRCISGSIEISSFLKPNIFVIAFRIQEYCKYWSDLWNLFEIALNFSVHQICTSVSMCAISNVQSDLLTTMFWLRFVIVELLAFGSGKKNEKLVSNVIKVVSSIKLKDQVPAPSLIWCPMHAVSLWNDSLLQCARFQWVLAFILMYELNILCMLLCVYRAQSELYGEAFGDVRWG